MKTFLSKTFVFFLIIFLSGLIVVLVNDQVFAQGEREEEDDDLFPTNGEGEGEADRDGSTPPNNEEGRNSQAEALAEAERDARENLARERESDNELEQCEVEYEGVKEKSGGGKYVPVKEVEGSLMQFTRDINQQTGDIKELAIQMCLHSKALKRIAYKYEVTEFLEKPQLRAIAAEAVDQYKTEIFQFVFKGYQSDFREDSPLFVDDWTEYRAEGIAEATGRVMDTVSKTESLFKDDLNQILEQRSAYTIGEDLSCSITAEQIEKANDPKSDMPNSQKLDVFLAVQTEPGCTLRGAYRVVKNKIDTEIGREQEKRQLDYIASGGYKPVRECVERGQNDLCLKWKTTVPVSAVRDSVSGALNANLNRYLNIQLGDADKENANGPQLSEVRTFTSSHSGNTAYPTGDEDNLNSGLKPTTNDGGSGGEGGGGGGGSGGGGGGSGGGGGGGNNFNLAEFLEEYFNFRLPTDPDVPDEDTMRNMEIRPLIFAFFQTPTEQDLLDDPDLYNTARVSWLSLNAKLCKAGNNWLNGTAFENSVDTLYSVNKKLDTIGNAVIQLPLYFQVNLKREREVVSQNNLLRPDETEIQTTWMTVDELNHKKLTRTARIRLTNTDVKRGDAFTLGIRTASGHFEEVYLELTGNPTAASTINQFETAITNAGGNELHKYKFIYSPNQGQFEITVEPKYIIACENDKGTTSRTVIVTRP